MSRVDIYCECSLSRLAITGEVLISVVCVYNFICYCKIAAVEHNQLYHETLMIQIGK